MKKIIFSICLAALAVGCTKTEVNYTEPDQIAFAPVAQMNTKAAIETAAFETTQDLYVFANAGLDLSTDENTTVELGECTEAYLRNAKFTRGSATDAYTGAYYWPNVKSLSFAGYIDAGNVATKTTDGKFRTSINDDLTQITVSDYVQPDTGNNDLMYFFTDRTYSKASASTEVVAPVMKHACSWLVFNFYGTTVTSGWKIHELKVLDIAKSGTATITASSVAWTEGATDQVYQVYAYNATGTTLSTSAASFTNEKNIIVIPQLPTELYIKYSYVSQAGTTIVEETTVPLAFNGEAEWAAGYKYTYDVTVTATAIEIKPTANTWVDYDYDSATGGNQPIPGTI